MDNTNMAQQLTPIPIQLKHMREHAGLSMKGLAVAMGYKGSSSYQRYEDPGGFTKSYFPLEFVEKLASALVGKGDPPIDSDEVYALAGWSPSESGYPMTEAGAQLGMEFAGTAEAGTFRSVDIHIQETPSRVSTPRDPRYLKAKQYTWLVMGDSMNQAGIEDGMYAVGIDYNDYVEHYGELRDGMFVIAERRRYGGSEIELTVKEAQIFRDRVDLKPQSSNPAYKTLSIPLNGDSDPDVEQIKILAIVTWAGRTFGA